MDLLIDRAQNFVVLETKAAQMQGENLEFCFAAGKNIKPCTPSEKVGRGNNTDELTWFSARPKNLWNLEHYQPFVLWNI